MEVHKTQDHHVLKKIFVISFILLFFACPFFIPANPVSASDSVETIFFGELESDKEGCEVFTILNLILDVLSYGVVIAGALGITVFGVQYLTAKGDEAQVTKAKRRIFEIVIGLAVYAVLWAILNFVLPGGQFSGNSCSVKEETSQDEDGKEEPQLQAQEEQCSDDEDDENDDDSEECDLYDGGDGAGDDELYTDDPSTDLDDDSQSKLYLNSPQLAYRNSALTRNNPTLAYDIVADNNTSRARNTSSNPFNNLSGSKILIEGDGNQAGYGQYLKKMAELLHATDITVKAENDSTLAYDEDSEDRNSVYYRISQMNDEELAEYDFVLISAGTNDYGRYPVALRADDNECREESGDSENSTKCQPSKIDTSSVEGAVRGIVAEIKSANALRAANGKENIHLVFFSPIHRSTVSIEKNGKKVALKGKNCDKIAKEHGEDLAAYRTAIKDGALDIVRPDSSSPYINRSSDENVYYVSGANMSQFEDMKNSEYSTDGIHPTEQYSNMLATAAETLFRNIDQTTHEPDKLPEVGGIGKYRTHRTKICKDVSKSECIAKVAEMLAWPYKTSKKTFVKDISKRKKITKWSQLSKKGHPTTAFQYVYNSVRPKHFSLYSSKWGNGTSIGASCDVFVGTVVKFTKVGGKDGKRIDKNFPFTLSGQKSHLKKSKKWKLVTSKDKSGKKRKAQRGDICISGNHIKIYLGNKRIANAHYKKSYGSHVGSFGIIEKGSCTGYKVYRAKK